MTALRIDDFKQYSDVLRTRQGELVTLRFVEPGDAEELQNYFRSLSTRSRYNRFLGAMSELPRNVLDHFIHVGERDEFSVIATVKVDGFESVIGEARYALHPESDSVEFGISIDDQAMDWGTLSTRARSTDPAVRAGWSFVVARRRKRIALARMATHRANAGALPRGRIGAAMTATVHRINL